MLKRKESVRIIFAAIFSAVVVFFNTPLRNICAEELFSISAGFGDVGVKMQDERFRSDSHSTAYSMGIGVDLEKEDSPLRLSFRAISLFTNKDVESWDSASGGVHQENQLDIHGVTLEAHGYRMIRTCSIRENTIRITPYLGGGIVYRRFKLEREWFRGTMFPLSFPVDTAYSLSDQCIVAIGGMPEAGVSVEFPQSGVECIVHVGWAFLAAKSEVNYQVSIAGNGEGRYSFRSDTSGSWCMADMRVIKDVDSFSLTFGIAWEMMTIDDESVLLFDTSIDDVYLPVPEIEMTQTTAWIGLTYPF